LATNRESKASSTYLKLSPKKKKKRERENKVNIVNILIRTTVARVPGGSTSGRQGASMAPLQL
jgi:hypothetical protein